MDFKLTITRIETNPQELAREILDEFGASYDAVRGDFQVGALDHSTIEIKVRELATGDVQVLIEDLEHAFGIWHEQIDISKYERGRWFPTNLDDGD